MSIGIWKERETLESEYSLVNKRKSRSEANLGARDGERSLRRDGGAWEYEDH